MNMHEDTGRNISASWGILSVTDRLSVEMPHLLLSHTYTHTERERERQTDRQTDGRTYGQVHDFPGERIAAVRNCS